MLSYKYVGFGVFTTMAVKITIFQAVTPCNPVEFYRGIEGTYCPHLQGRRVSYSQNQREAGSS
jgi:hypothetical protein